MSQERVRRHSRRAGISLLEVTIALAILGFGILGAAAAQLSAMKFSSQSREHTEAQYLAQQKMEGLLLMSGTVLTGEDTGGSYTAEGSALTPDSSFEVDYQRSWKVSPDANTGMFTLDVSVSWTNPRGVTQTVNLRSSKAGA